LERFAKKKICKAARNKACRDGTSVHHGDLGTSTKQSTDGEMHGRDTNNMVSFIVISRSAELYKVINYFKLCNGQVCDVQCTGFVSLLTLVESTQLFHESQHIFRSNSDLRSLLITTLHHFYLL